MITAQVKAVEQQQKKLRGLDEFIDPPEQRAYRCMAARMTPFQHVLGDL